jgi:WD repeat-containing protein 19
MFSLIRLIYGKVVYNIGDTVNEQEYTGSVRDVKMNDFSAVVLLDNKVMVHLIEPNKSKNKQSKQINEDKNNNNNKNITLPDRTEGPYSKATCIGITPDFLYYGTEAGTVEIFCFSEWMLLAASELRLDNSIKQVYPNHTGTRVIVVDIQNQVFLYNPITGGGINQSILQFELLPQNIVHILWDLDDKNIVMLFDGKFVHTYVYCQNTMNGSILVKLGPLTVSADGSIDMEPSKVEIASGSRPLASTHGLISCQLSSGILYVFN